MRPFYTARNLPPFEDRVGECYCPTCEKYFWPGEEYVVDDQGCPWCSGEVLQLPDRYGMITEDAREFRRQMVSFAVAMSMSVEHVEDMVHAAIRKCADKVVADWGRVAEELSSVRRIEEQTSFVYWGKNGPKVLR